MSTTVTGKLNKAASQFQAGESTGFGINIGVKYYDRETKADAWTNYQAAVFAKAPAQVKFYQEALVEGAIVEVSGEKCKIRQFQGNSGLSLSIEILDAKLGAVFAPQGQAQQQQQRQQQPAPQQRQQPAPQQSYQPQIGKPAQPAPQQSYQPAPQQSYQPAPQQSYQPAPQQSYQPAPQQSYQPQIGKPAQHALDGSPDFESDVPFL
jgi:single-strand DNA-binding protein